MIARLGLRYRPTNQADLEAHAGMLALLAEDLSDIPTDLLAAAIQRHVASSPYMPKAADLAKLAREADGGRKVAHIPRTGPSYAHDLAAARNAQLTRDDIEWIVDSNGTLRLHDRPDWTSRRTRELEQQAERDRQLWQRMQEK